MGRPGKYFKMFFRDPARRRKMWNRYVHHKSIYAKGQGEVGFILSAVLGFQAMMVWWLFIRDMVPGIPRWVFVVTVPVLLIGKMLLFYAIGYFWDKEKIFNIEQTWSNERNPIAKGISTQLLNGDGMEVK